MFERDIETALLPSTRGFMEQLAELSEGDRDLVIRAARLRGLPNELPTLPWEEFDKVKGIVSLGGNADEDCKALYDG